MQKPPWLLWAINEIGTREEPENRGAAIRRYIRLAHCGAEGQPWCATFVNAALEANGVKGSRSPGSQSYRHNPDFLQLLGPALGAIVVYWRISKISGLGHVGFYLGEDSHGYIDTLGGNESDMVRTEMFNPHGSTFGLVGYYWPTSVALPEIRKIPVQVAASSGNSKVT